MSGNQILTGQNFGRRTAVTPIGKKGRDGPNPLRVRERESRAEIKLNHLTDPRVRSCGTGLEGKRIGNSPPGAQGVFRAANDNDWTTGRFKDGRPVRLACFGNQDDAAGQEAFLYYFRI